MSLQVPSVSACTLDRDHFPKGFIIGAASSAFQVEGAAKEGGRCPSIWDTFCEKKGWVLGKAIDHYNRYKDDVALMKWMGLDAYRFSISWSRILPTGRKNGGVNEEGVKYYKDLIQELVKNGITPFVTLFHWDVPQALEDEYGGFRSREIIDDFEDYADVCFTHFGSLVKHWITINEPWSFSEGGYATGTLAPGRGDVSEDPTSKIKHLRPPTKCSHITEPAHSHGDPAREPYLVTHHQLLAHARAVKLYRRKYQRKPKKPSCWNQGLIDEEEEGEIGLALNSLWLEPHSEKDKAARDRALDFTLNWFLLPITCGDYPLPVKKVMKQRKIRSTFSCEEKTMIQGSVDFLGINYYTSSYVRDASNATIEIGKESYTTDAKVEYDRKCFLGDDWGAVDWLKVYPEGLKKLLKYVSDKYDGPIYITENGFGENEDESLSIHEALYDQKRVSYHHQHLRSMIEAIEEYNIDVRGYFAWSLWDNFEWAACFNVRFGTIHVDYKNDLKRTPKFSAQWFKYILQKPRKKSAGVIDTKPEKIRSLQITMNAIAQSLNLSTRLPGQDLFMMLENGYEEKDYLIEGDEDIDQSEVEHGDLIEANADTETEVENNNHIKANADSGPTAGKGNIVGNAKLESEKGNNVGDAEVE